MLDLNHILLFIACLSPVVLLVRTWRRAALNRSWRLVALLVLAVTGASWLIAPRQAGFVGGGAWLLFLFLPAWGLRRSAELAAEERYGAARRLADFLLPLHPFRRLRNERRMLRALELAQNGDSGA
ncbi:MAG TPA: hypothetical protein VF551_03125, partial [Chthoniobacterales bacterium]